MPITAGSLSCRCFQVSGKPRADFRDAYALEIERHKFSPPKIDRGEFRSLGWVNPRRILETEIDLDQVTFGERMILAIRIDKISLNSRIYKAQLYDKLSQYRKQTGRDRLSRDEQRTLEEKLQIEMAKKQSPSTTIHEMAWNMKIGLVIYTATGETAALAFQGLFTETFELSLEPLFPYLRADRFASVEGLQGELLEAPRAVFSPRLAGANGATDPLAQVISIESE